MAQHPPRSPRPSQTGAGRPTGGVHPPDVERALALRDVMEHAVKVQKEITAPTRLRSSHGKLLGATLVCVPLLAFCVYSWVVRPEFIWGPGVVSLPPAQQDANVRFAMYLLAQRVEAYRRTHDDYPSSLEALGERAEGIAYARMSNSVFELRTAQNGKPIIFRSNESIDAFLGNSAAVIQGNLR